MSVLFTAVNCLAGAIVLAEALNKLERAQPLRAGLCTRARLVEVLKVLGWSFLALAAGGALVNPLLAGPPPSLQDVAALGGFALLVVRSRLRESVKPEAARSS